MSAAPDASSPQHGLSRLEAKVDKIADSIAKLVLIEERQSTQSDRIGRAEAATARLEGTIKAVSEAQQSTDRKLDKWINRGVAAWAVLTTLFGVAKVFNLF